MLLRGSLSLLLLLMAGCEPPAAPRAAAGPGAATGASRSGELVTGRVVGVADGDTITVLDAGQRQHKIRFVGIDAPEKAMAFGARSKQNLSELVYGRTVQVEVRAVDRYQREVGRILLDGQDINLAQVQSGMAWVYRQYLKELSQVEASAYLSAEQQAQAAGRGLWQDAAPIPPWNWRKAKRSLDKR